MRTKARPENWLPPERAFVVQLSAHAEIGTHELAGRVEHVTTGESAHFASLAELLAFIGRLLGRTPEAT